jgi:hypothetical protein
MHLVDVRCLVVTMPTKVDHWFWHLDAILALELGSRSTWPPKPCMSIVRHAKSQSSQSNVMTDFNQSMHCQSSPTKERTDVHLSSYW